MMAPRLVVPNSSFASLLCGNSVQNGTVLQLMNFFVELINGKKFFFIDQAEVLYQHSADDQSATFHADDLVGKH